MAIETLREQIASADTELKALALEDERMRRLMTVPGVGPVTAARFIAAIDRVERFPNASSVASYLGLIPSEDTTGVRIKRKRLTRAGAPQVRWALGQAAWSWDLRRPRDPMGQWARRIGERRGAQVALTALARKLTHVLVAMWREKATDDPARSARLIAA